MANRHYMNLEQQALQAGIDPQAARFRVQFGQLQVGTFIPELDLPPGEVPPEPSEEFGTGTGTRVPEPGTTPGAVPVRADRWDFDAEPLATYRLAAGDTLVGLAATYLGGIGTRWREIWDVQTDAYRSKRTPDRIVAEDIIRMPREATENMLAFLAIGEPSGQTPGELTEGQKTKSKLRRALPWILGGAGLLGGGYLIYRASK